MDGIDGTPDSQGKMAIGVMHHTTRTTNDFMEQKAAPGA
jgi:hypothetical protein